MVHGNRRAQTRPHDEDQAPARLRLWLEHNDGLTAGLARLRELRGCHCGDHIKRIRERTDTTAEDAKREFNSENVRMFPPGSPSYLVTYPEQNDTESINRPVDDHLPLRRARSYGWERQLLDLLAHDHVVNSVARFRYGPEGTHRLRRDEQAA
jgi:hypothetical protein